MHSETKRTLKAANKNAPAPQKRLMAIGGWIVVGVLLVGGIYCLFSI
jgi:hypothetical protein